MSSVAKFATLFRKSRFVEMGDFRNAIVNGKIYNITGDDLYVDLGMKFHAVVKKPQVDDRRYVRGAVVKLRLLDYEITDRFIGSKDFTSLREADAILLGLESSPVGSNQRKQQKSDTVTK